MGRFKVSPDECVDVRIVELRFLQRESLHLANVDQRFLVSLQHAGVFGTDETKILPLFDDELHNLSSSHLNIVFHTRDRCEATGWTALPTRASWSDHPDPIHYSVQRPKTAFRIAILLRSDSICSSVLSSI